MPESNIEIGTGNQLILRCSIQPPQPDLRFMKNGSSLVMSLAAVTG